MGKSNHGKVVSWTMDINEFYQKYGFYPPLHPEFKEELHGQETKNFDKLKGMRRWEWSRITKTKYKDYRAQGLNDSQIISRTPFLTIDQLLDLKKLWKIKN